ncbi:lytic transglycosylase domain-containing protein [Seohaeicola zhoushanensis]|uniref:Murein transglycosylase n=1 Tax=Seohaeicola zhoushanensis TaxID=1569283 RepID=A0A8J3GV70_9RHOB|nr:lytic transglycosylase domain-containing protein [Seohaeicola zhoushanensis]GHF42561.1 murein transglycosylase [Seohaeicola zhoushanensis]
MKNLRFAGALAALAIGVPSLATAEAPQPFPVFEAKRIKVPGAAVSTGVNPVRKRITVQIDPVEQAAILAARPPMEKVVPPVNGPDEGAPRKSAGSYEWFWNEVSADIGGGPGRFSQAMRAIEASDKVRAPRLQALQEIARAQGAPILRSTVGTSVSPALVLAVIAVESAGRADAVSGAGAAGLMQLMPDTATRFGVTDRMAADQSISGGVKYLDWLLKEFNNDPILALAGYNAGEGAVKNHKGVPPYAETRDYVPKVLAAWKVASGLCRTPPELISDGCVFVSMN